MAPATEAPGKASAFWKSDSSSWVSLRAEAHAGDQENGARERHGITLLGYVCSYVPTTCTATSYLTFLGEAKQQMPLLTAVFTETLVFRCPDARGDASRQLFFSHFCFGRQESSRPSLLPKSSSCVSLRSISSPNPITPDVVFAVLVSASSANLHSVTGSVEGKYEYVNIPNTALSQGGTECLKYIFKGSE